MQNQGARGSPLLCVFARSGRSRTLHRHRFVRIGRKPRIPAIKAAAELSAIVIEDTITALDSTGELNAGNLNLSVLEAGDARIGNGNPPEHGRGEICGFGSGIHVAGFVEDLRRNARVGLREYVGCEQQE